MKLVSKYDVESEILQVRTENKFHWVSPGSKMRVNDTQLGPQQAIGGESSDGIRGLT